MSNKYLVVVHPPKPAKSDLRSAGSYTVAEPPTVQHITAPTPAKAAEGANVRPGGYCLVAPEADVRRFDRPAVAALEERDTSGGRLPEAMPSVAAA